MDATTLDCGVAVWSHRGVDESLGHGKLVSETGLHDLATRGIRRFDLDLSTTKDGGIVVSHPQPLKDVLGVDVFATTMRDLTTAAAGSTLLCVWASLETSL